VTFFNFLPLKFDSHIWVLKCGKKQEGASQASLDATPNIGAKMQWSKQLFYHGQLKVTYFI